MSSVENINSKLLDKIIKFDKLNYSLIEITQILINNIKNYKSKYSILIMEDNKKITINTLNRLLFELEHSNISEIKEKFNINLLSDHLSDIIYQDVISMLNDIAHTIDTLICIISKIPQTIISVDDYANIKKRINSLGNIKNIINLNYDFAKVKQNQFTKCTTCNIPMELNIEASQLVCPVCKETGHIIGIALKEEQYFLCDGKKNRNSTYEPMRHHDAWLRSIQALEECDIKEVVAAIKKCLLRDNIRINNTLEYETVRKYLKEINRTKYNKNIPKIMKELTGVAPPKLTIKESEEEHRLFSRIIKIYDTIINVNKEHSHPYCPYFIYKILEHLFHDNREKIRILKYIHLQSTDTIIKHDHIFEKICAHNVGIKFCKTRRLY